MPKQKKPYDEEDFGSPKGRTPLDTTFARGGGFDTNPEIVRMAKFELHRGMCPADRDLGKRSAWGSSMPTKIISSEILPSEVSDFKTISVFQHNALFYRACFL